MAVMMPHQAPHPGWEPQRRSASLAHMASMSFTPTSAPQPTRTFPANIIDLPLPMYQPTSGPTSMPYSPTTYGFDVASPVAHYPVQQHYNMNYQGPYSPASMADSSSSVPHSPYIKAEAPSPASLASSDDRSMTPSLKSSSPEPSNAASTVFGTGVDCLMRAIQAQQKQDGAPPRAAVQHAVVAPGKRRKNKKMHQCPFQGCHKVFYQKTHLDIHCRRHTGQKPYVRELDRLCYHG
jgi:hypothetical protein